jgi:hypothetical protein
LEELGKDENIIKMNLKATGHDSVGCIHLTLDMNKVADSYEHGNTP